MTSITEGCDRVGRFAPSPTGPLHLGSLVAALASALDARASGGRWLVRMEDVDTPRTVPGAADAILRTLAVCGFEWDGPVMVQGRRGEAYAAALTRLRQAGLAYRCVCSRRAVESVATRRAVDGGWCYPGTCRDRRPAPTHGAWRVRVPTAAITFADRIQGVQTQVLAEAVGDFVVRRADDLFAYQLAVVVDDAEQGVTDVVRGADLIDSTPRQIFLQQALGYSVPTYAHLPVVVNAAGEKLSKQTFASAVQPQHAGATLVMALRALGQPVDAGLANASVATIWAWAQAHWDLARVPRRRTIAEAALQAGAASAGAPRDDELPIP